MYGSFIRIYYSLWLCIVYIGNIYDYVKNWVIQQGNKIEAAAANTLQKSGPEIEKGN